ncbi:MAG: CRISPR-associated protein Cas4 [Candidatus Hydrothermae bacterium]|nr:CRISPR-associated protein Cas4 [Candidatus Hydrothermae bacterium]
MNQDPLRPYLMQAYLVCPRQAWLEGHGIHGDQQHDDLAEGRWVHETSYRDVRKEIWVDEHLKVDLFEGELVAEVKKSSRKVDAARWQLLYYLYYLKHYKGIQTTGILLFPRERRREDVRLTAERERHLEEKMEALRELLRKPRPPQPTWKGVCARCSLAEYCWSEVDDGT